MNKNKNNHYQLFKKIPDNEFIEKICNIYGIRNLDTSYTFTLKDLESRGTVKKLNDMSSEISEYYLNCKFKKYMKELDEKRSITILRHFLKPLEYKVFSREKYSNNQKYLLYYIRNMSKRVDVDFVVRFD